ncbi:unnamed protein product, partial [Ectocarpus sp. 13 AM-2016]
REGGGILTWYGKPYREPVQSGWNTRVMKRCRQAGSQAARLSRLSGNISAVLVTNLHQKEPVLCCLKLFLVHQVLEDLNFRIVCRNAWQRGGSSARCFVLS